MRKVFVISFLFAGLWLLGCAGMQSDSGDAKSARQVRQVDNFAEPEIEEATLAGYDYVELSAEDERIEIAGAQHGGAPKMQKPAKKSDLNKPEFWPATDGIPAQMEDLQWGMSIKKVYKIFEDKIVAKYAEQLKSTAGDLLAEDRIRSMQMRELRTLKESFVFFEGQTTGYESNIVYKEFTHNNDESMLVWDAEKFVEYLFFINGRFWKRLRLFRMDQVQGLDFHSFLASIEEVMGGPGKEFVDREGNLDRITWRDATTYVDIIDGESFYGVYGLRFTSAVTQTHVAKLRTNADRKTLPTTSSASDLIEEVTSSVDLDDHKESVIDSYTGTTPNADAGFSQGK